MISISYMTLGRRICSYTLRYKADGSCFMNGETPHILLHTQTHQRVVMCPSLSIACFSLKYCCVLCFLIRNLLLVCFGPSQSLASWFFHLLSLVIVAVAISYYLPRSLPSEIYLFILCLTCPPSCFMCL